MPAKTMLPAEKTRAEAQTDDGEESGQDVFVVVKDSPKSKKVDFKLLRLPC